MDRPTSFRRLGELEREWDADPALRAAYEREVPYTEVAQAIIALRVRHGLSQSEFARRVGKPQSYIARLESGRSNVQIGTLHAFAEAMGERLDLRYDRGREPATRTGTPSGTPALKEAVPVTDDEVKRADASRIFAEAESDPARDLYLSRCAEAFRKSARLYDEAGDAALARTAAMDHIACSFAATPKPAPGQRFVPVVEFVNGQVWPDRAALPDDFREYIEHRASTAANAVLQARYLDLLWDLYRSVEHGKQAIDAYLASASVHWNSTYETRTLDVTDNLRRAGQLAKTFKKKQEDTCRTADAIWRTAIAQADYRSIVHLSDAVLPFAPADLLLQYIEDLRTAATFFRGKNEFHFERVALEHSLHAMDRLKDCDIRPATLEHIADSFEAEGDFHASAGGQLVAHHWFDQAHAVYHKLGSKDDCNRLLIKMRRSAKRGVATEMKEVSAKVDVPAAEIERYVDAFVAAPIEEALRAMGVIGIPSIEAAEALAERSRKDFPLLSTIFRQRLDSEGNLVSTPRTPEENHEAGLVELLVRQSQLFVALQMQPIYDHLRKAGALTEAVLCEYLENRPVTRELDAACLRMGLSRLLAEDYISAVHILVPLLERAIRVCYERVGFPIFEPSRTKPGQTQLVGLGRMLEDEGFREKFGRERSRYFGIVLVDERGVNLRNSVAHGILPAEAFNLGMALLTLHLLLVLASLDVSESDSTATP